MTRSGRATGVVIVIGVLLLAGAIAFAVWWRWSYAQDPVEVQCVADAEAAAAAYLVKEPHPRLGNFDRLTGTGFDHTPFGNPAVRAVRAVRTAHFTNADTGKAAMMDVTLLILPAGPGDDASKAALKMAEDQGGKLIFTHPRYKG